MPEATWNDNCHCGKLFKDHTGQDIHDCELTKDEECRGWKKTPFG